MKFPRNLKQAIKEYGEESVFRSFIRDQVIYQQMKLRAKKRKIKTTKKSKIAKRKKK